MKSKKLWIAIAAVIIVVGGGWYGYTKLQGNKQLTQQQTTRTAAVTKGDIATTVSGSGTVAAAEKETVKASVEGTVKAVLAAKGDTVKKGQQLVTFEPKDMSSQIKQEQLNLKQKQLNLESAELELKKLAQDGAEDLEDKKMNIAKIQLDIELSQQKIKDYQDQQLPPDPILAPIDGKITSLSVNTGDVLKANAEVAQLVNLEKLNVSIQVDELDIVKMKTGMAAQVTIDALPGKAVEGQVTEVADEGTAQNGVSVFTVTIGLNKAEGVKIGMTAQSVIKVEEKKDVLLLPIEAVQQVGGRYLVFVPASEGAAGAQGGATSGQPNTTGPGNVRTGGNRTGANGATGGFQRNGGAGGNNAGASAAENGTAGRRPVQVEVGIHNETFIEITSGLKEGDAVILPTIVSSSGNQQNVRIGAGGIGGIGGIGGGGAVQVQRINGGGGGGGGNR